MRKKSRESDTAVAVLMSGGLDSAVLVAELCKSFESVQPIYVRAGMFWETQELTRARAFLVKRSDPAIRPLRVIDLPMADVYRAHWSVSGIRVPRAGTDDGAVHIPGRNVVLICKAAVLCALQNIHVLAIGPLAGNPFPDARPIFFERLASALSLGLDHPIQLIAPFLGSTKAEIIRRGAGLPLGLTFSCISPRGEFHCGRCNKCRERKAAFLAAGVEDPTAYASNHLRTRSKAGGEPLNPARAGRAQARKRR